MLAARAMAGMARKPRELVAGGLYHLWARGNRRALIYEDDEDRDGVPGAARQDRDVARLAVPHVLPDGQPRPPARRDAAAEPRCRHAGVPWVYAQAFNRRHTHAGHVFQGRYGAARSKDEAQLVTAAAYIAANPVAAGMCSGGVRLAVEQPRGGEDGRGAEWLDTPRLLEYFGAAGGDPWLRYAGAVEERCRVAVSPAACAPNRSPSSPAPRPLSSSNDVPEPDGKHLMTGAGGRGGGRPRRRRVVPRGPADAGGVPGQAGPAVHARQRGRWRGPQRSRERRRQARRPRGGVLHARRVRGGRGRAGVPHLQAPRRAGLRAGRRAGPQLPHGLLRAEAARAPGRGRDGARARRRGRRRDGGDPGRQGPGRDRLRGRVERREGADRPRGGRGRGRCAPTAPGRTRPRKPPAAAWTS